MTSPSHRPPGWPAVAPRIFTADVDGLVAFLRTTFDAACDVHPGRPSEMWIDGSVIIVSDGGGLREPTPAFTYVYVPDTEAAFARALAAGATQVEPPTDQFYGDRRATIRDPWGNHWQLATRIAARD
ncbi:MAG TPA: VOC family protein [Caulobacteraceae bacterium]|jgi:uncharacterized glyoxalase superfamily protein PhnB|nr:VOC family protein [Caulobacteraceae bacterium]